LDRNQFLQTRWIKYPTARHNNSLKGRLLRRNAAWILVFENQNHELQSPLLLEEFRSDKTPIDELLCEGDWVEILSPSESDGGGCGGGTVIRLLSPCLTTWKDQSSQHKQALPFKKFIFEVEKWFYQNSFSGVLTPSLVDNPGTEPFLDLFSVDLKQGSLYKKKYLPTSPELHLKKALALGYPKIFEIRPCFRNNESSEWHQPEFIMCEWYRSFASLEKLQEDILALITHFDPQWSTSTVVKKSMAELFSDYLDFTLTPNTSEKDLLQLCTGFKLTPPPDCDFDDLFYFLYVEKIEKHLHKYPLLFITDYPPSQAALARINTNGWGDRFEFYINGIEIANAFHELNDPKIQRLRAEEDLLKKQKLGKEIPPLDEDFFHFLEMGMPPSSGVALGVDRLYMSLHKVSDIKDLRLFPIF
jgi:lysyl-tRNA synthetase class 2